MCGMKKIFLFIVLLIMGYNRVIAQTANEWLRQKKTQLAYLANQIAALQVYESSLGKGYSIARHGLHAIGVNKGSEASLHKSFFASLLSPNPALINNDAIWEATTAEGSIKYLLTACQQRVVSNDMVTNEERNYVQSVTSSLLQSCQEQMVQLQRLFSNNSLELTDDERLLRIQVISDDLKDKESFTIAFNNHIQTLIAQRVQEQDEIGSVKSFYNLK